MKTNQTTTFTNIGMVVLFVLFLLSGSSVFAQHVKEVSVAVENTIGSDDTAAVSQNTVSESTTMNFVSWFMGTNQTPNANSGTGAIGTKKQMINSGISPNRLLIKAFLKKASNYATTVA